MNRHLRKLAILLLLTSFNALAKVPVIKDALPSLDVPSKESISLVTEAWSYMNPAQPAEQCDYQRAYQLNYKAYELGHAEGASNIGVLYENGWGVNKSPEQAEYWYLMAIHHSQYHSAQAELGIARLYLQKPHTDANLQKVADYINQARRVAADRYSLWKSSRQEYEYWASVLEAQFKEASE